METVMDLNVTKFNAPKGTEQLYGENPYNVTVSYDLELDEKDLAAIQYEVVVRQGVSENSLEEGTRALLDGQPFEFSSMVDVGTLLPSAELCFRYRLFTAESSQGAQISFSDFETKVPSKAGKAVVSLPGELRAEVSLEPGGYARFKCEISDDAAGDWCAIAVIRDQSGNLASSTEVASDGKVKLNAGMAGKPKIIYGVVGALGANDWVEVCAKI